MNNRYIDFAPSKTAARQSSKGTRTPLVQKKSKISDITPRTTNPKRVRTTPVRTSTAVRSRPMSSFIVTSSTQSYGARRPASTTSNTRIKKTPNKTAKVGFSSEKPSLGIVEDLNNRFVYSDVPKRPLNHAAHFTTSKTGIAAAKAQKVGIKTPTSAKPVENKVQKPVDKSVDKPQKTSKFRTPKSPFIKSTKVDKRPLSKNVYSKKKPIAPKEEPKGPVTIIAKPEKDAHTGMIVTIILTIILGAAAGTVAFLLLPK